MRWEFKVWSYLLKAQKNISFNLLVMSLLKVIHKLFFFFGFISRHCLATSPLLYITCEISFSNKAQDLFFYWVRFLECFLTRLTLKSIVHTLTTWASICNFWGPTTYHLFHLLQLGQLFWNNLIKDGPPRIIRTIESAPLLAQKKGKRKEKKIENALGFVFYV